jgi:hypothetical protein
MSCSFSFRLQVQQFHHELMEAARLTSHGSSACDLAVSQIQVDWEIEIV